jgi:hypothetical protein
MTSEQFCFWLQGFFELSQNVNTLDMKQVQVIKNHLNLVFAHDSGSCVQYQNYLQDIHDGQDGASTVLKC